MHAKLTISTAPACTSSPRPSWSLSVLRSTPLLVVSRQRKKSALTPSCLPAIPDSAASFLTDYFHTVIILAIACYFTVQAFTNSDVDSVGKLYELVEAAGQLHPVSGNSQGSYLTMNSKSVWLPLSL